ncbi:hypothetical protein EW146_g3716 [Bondarzewia mesenterica]|uniref:Uncharacterized protein n=1 Tax=Bondarzewia mesenterica TaxID=1095465 RepID=A0A4S4LWQ0_9AGAM|nr:hypothetical protein EW146_g3716 [Bondarzewia mesenterica]
MPTIAQELIRQVAHAAYTAFLFTKSDIKTTVVPVTFFAIAAAPISAAERLPHTVLWIWLHLLQFDVSNQTLRPEEDVINKADRPLPRNRISLQSAIRLRWILIPTCWALSAFYSAETVYASIALVACTIVYDELSFHSGHWMIRNLVNAAGFASFEAGATLVAGSDYHRLDRVAVLSVCISAGIFATTIHSQDFKDEHGDRAVGRQTIPIIFPSVARYTVVVPLLLWSIGLSAIWKLDAFTSVAFMSLAAFVGLRFLTLRTVASDQISFYWYNVWLSIAHALPGYYRLYSRDE